MTTGPLAGKWALILGASSGFGAATARELARCGMHIIGVHLDRRAALPAIEELVHSLTACGVQALYFNVNAADPLKRQEVLDEVQPTLGGGALSLFMHSLAFGTLKPYLSQDPKAH